jgi:hypothetical protein
MSLEAVFLLLGFALLGALLVATVCSVIYPEAQRSAREWVNTAISIVTLVVLAWTARSIVDQVAEMRKVYPEIHSQSMAMGGQVDSYIATERARMVMIPSGVQKTGDKDPRPKFMFTLNNMGRTGALVSGLLTECDVSPRQISTTPAYGERKPDPAALFILAGTSLSIQPGHECVPSQPLSEEDYAGLEAKTKIILFSGYILYQDVLGETWKKHFGMYGNGDGHFFAVGGADAYNGEEKVEPGVAPFAVQQ